MRIKTDFLVFTVIIISLVFLLIISIIELIKLPDDHTKTLAITLSIPILGAIITGIGIELLKFIMERSKEDQNYKKEKIRKLTNLAIGLSMNMVQRDNGVTYIDIDRFSEDLKEFISEITSEINSESMHSIRPLIEILQKKGHNKSEVAEMKIILGKVIVQVRNSYGFRITKEIEELIINSIV